MEKALMFLNIASALIVLYMGTFHIINMMTEKTFFPVKLAWVLLTTGALAVVLGPIYGVYTTSVNNILIHLGLATLVFGERRFRKHDDSQLLG